MRAIQVALILVVAAVAAATEVTPGRAGAQTTRIGIMVNAAPLVLDAAPIVETGRVFVPLRGIFERLGASVVYHDGQIAATKGATAVALQVGSTAAAVNGQPQVLDHPPFVRGARIFVPLRFISQALGTTVAYSSATQTVEIVAPTTRRRRYPQER